MKYAILGDVHANLDALAAVVDAAQKEGVDGFFCVGDLVGYAAQPVECIKLLQEIQCGVVAGNHDHATIGKTSLEYFNPDARRAVEWTRQQLSDAEFRYLESLPYTLVHGDFTVSHATLHTPQFFEYIQTIFDAQLSFEELENQVCFLGHSHVPVNFFDTMPITYNLDPKVKLDPKTKVLCNVGSVGQPRDGNPHAAWGLYDDDKKQIEIRRVKYDVESAARKIIAAGLPKANADRLFLGR